MPPARARFAFSLESKKSTKTSVEFPEVFAVILLILNTVSAGHVNIVVLAVALNDVPKVLPMIDVGVSKFGCAIFCFLYYAKSKVIANDVAVLLSAGLLVKFS